MENLKILSAENLLFNLQQFGSKKICAMVKANAYGHGTAEIVSILKDKVDYFGVSSVDEGISVRKQTEKPILVCSKVKNLRECKKHNLEFFVEEVSDLENALKNRVENNCHLKIDCGMNRYGTKDVHALEAIDKFVKEKDISLRSFCAHFSRTYDLKWTKKQYQKFLSLKNLVEQNVSVCFGGSNVFAYDFDFDMLRLGIGLYGYERKGLKPVMKIKSYILKVFFAKSGEFVGYGKKHKVKCDGLFAVVPLGYADGISRNLSENFEVSINGKNFQSVGNVCMDCFFVKVDANVKKGDEVEVLSNAEVFAKRLGTISYEVLTNFSKCRAKTKIE